MDTNLTATKLNMQNAPSQLEGLFPFHQEVRSVVFSIRDFMKKHSRDELASRTGKSINEYANADRVFQAARDYWLYSQQSMQAVSEGGSLPEKDVESRQSMMFVLQSALKIISAGEKALDEKALFEKTDDLLFKLELLEFKNETKKVTAYGTLADTIVATAMVAGPKVVKDLQVEKNANYKNFNTKLEALDALNQELGKSKIGQTSEERNFVREKIKTGLLDAKAATIVWMETLQALPETRATASALIKPDEYLSALGALLPNHPEKRSMLPQAPVGCGLGANS